MRSSAQVTLDEDVSAWDPVQRAFVFFKKIHILHFLIYLYPTSLPDV